MSSLQPLFDVKERLEYAAVAGTGLLGEDFRLQRAAENLKPLAAASPVFGKISAGLAKLMAAPAEERSGLLLDVLALVDAVAYTQGTFGMEGELTDLPTAGGTYQQISYGQLQPLLAALTTTGSGRMEMIQTTWDAHPEYFTDFRVLPALVAGLGDSYGEISDLNANILKKLGAAALPLLKDGFDPAGKRDMARRVEVIAAIGGPEATPWLREILPEAKKDVRTAALAALGGDQANDGMLLELAKTERGKNRDAVLESLAKLDGEEVRKFWSTELRTHSESVNFLRDNNTDWAAELVAAGLWERVEKMLSGGSPVPAKDNEDFSRWTLAVGKKTSPAMLQFWRWADSRMEDIDKLKTEKDQPVFAGVRLTDTQREVMLQTGPGPLRDYCLALYDQRPEMTRYLHTSFQAALLSLPATEVYEKYSPYIVTAKPLLDKAHKETLNNVLLRALGEVYWNHMQNCHTIVRGQAIAEPLDARWINRLVHAAWKNIPGRYCPFGGVDEVNGFDKHLVELVNPNDPEQCAQIIPYLRKRMTESGGWNSLSRYLLQFGGSPKGVLGEAMKKGKPAYVYYVWDLLNVAYKSLPAGEVAELCQEVLDAKWIRPVGRELAMAERALPWTIEQLRAGSPFPEWDEWNKMRP